MSFTDGIDDNDLLLEANYLLSEYGKLRQRFFEQAKGYYRQSASSEYYKESSLREQLDYLEKLKGQYKRICDILLDRGYRQMPDKTWRDSHNSIIIPKDILHFT